MVKVLNGNKSNKPNKQNNDDKSDNIITETCPKCTGKMEIITIDVDNLKNAIAIRIRCMNCNFEYPPLLFPKFADIPHLLWKSLYKKIQDFDRKELSL